MKLKYPVSLLLLLMSASMATCKRPPAKEYSSVDMLRKTVMRLDDEIEVIRPKAISHVTVAVSDSSRSKERDFIETIYKYKRMGDLMERDFSEDYERHLDLLNTLWLWARTQSELRSIEGLYTTYRRMQKDLAERRESLDTNKWSNLARTILSDAHASVPAALERIADFVVNQRLFVSANQVVTDR